MSKILVVTFTNTVDNYGQVFQYYATQQFLENRGHEVFVHVNVPGQSGFFKRIVLKSKAFLRKIIRLNIKRQKHSLSPDELEKQKIFDKWAESVARNEQLHPRKFWDFKNSKFKIMKCPMSELYSSDIDVAVVGSDQTWSYISDYHFLVWAKKGIKKISIAPSVGHKTFSEPEVERAKRLLSDFDMITVREDNGLDFCQKAGRLDAKKILDPTFLISRDEYEKIEKSVKTTREYILLYLLGGEIGISIPEIYGFAEREGLEIVYVASQGREDEYSKCYAEVGEWLNLIRGAKYVFTNSFHGMAFSIIYHKQFLVFPLVGLMNGMNGRILNLANLFKIEDHIFLNSLDSVKENIDYSTIDKLIELNKNMLENELEKINL